MAVSTATSSGRKACNEMIDSGFSIRIQGMRFPLTSSKLKPHGGHRFGRRATELGIALAGMHVAQIKQCAGMEYRQQYAIARGHVANIEVAAPFALAVEAGAHFAIGSHAQRADKRRERPRPRSENCSVPSRQRTAGARLMRKILVVYSPEISGQRVLSPNGPRRGPMAVHE